MPGHRSAGAYKDWRRIIRRSGWPIGYFTEHPDYLRLWLFTIGAGVLGSAARVAIVVYIVGPSPLMMTPAFFVLLEGIAACVLAPFAGSLIDRTSPLRCLRMVEAGQIVALATFIAIPGSATLILLVPVLSGLGILYQAARDAALLDTVPREAVARASGLDQAAAAIALLFGPALGALLVFRLDLRLVLTMLAALHLLLLYLVYRITAVENSPDHVADTSWTSFAPWRSLNRSACLALVIFFAGATMGALWLAVAPSIIMHTVAASSLWLGPQMMLAGFACVLGGLMTPAFLERHGPIGVMIVMALAESAAAAVYSISSTLVSSNLTITLLGFFAGGFGAAFYAYFQTIVELPARGRVFALIRQVDALAVLVAGAFAALFGNVPGWLLLFTAASLYAGCTIAVALLSLRRSSRTVRTSHVVTRISP
jgi:predicted MFS family arabinose efflux permease